MVVSTISDNDALINVVSKNILKTQTNTKPTLAKGFNEYNFVWEKEKINARHQP